MVSKFASNLCRLPRLLAWLGLWWATATVAATAHLPVEFSIRRWFPSERLPLSSVKAMVQTRDGFIWFAMNGGLGRFDGQNLQVFGAENTPELPVPVITSLAEDADGSLWVGSAGGGLVRYQGGRFQRFGGAQGLANEQVKALSMGADGRLWIGTDGGGVFVRERDGRFRHFGADEGLEDPFIIGLKADHSGELIVATFRQGPWRMRDGRFERLKLEPAPSGGRDLSLSRGPSGRVWLGTGDGVYHLEEGRLVRWAPGQLLDGAKALTAWEVSTNEVWIGTDRSLVRWKDGEWAAYPTGSATSPRMADAFLVDREGSVWLSVEGGGLMQLRSTPLVVLGSAEGLSGDEVTSVVHARDGSLWVGTTRGLTRHGADGLRSFSKADGLPDACVFSLQEDAAGAMWVSTRRGGIVRWTGTGFAAVSGGTGREVEVAWCLARGRGDTMWAGTTRGLVQFRDGRPVMRMAGPEGLSNNDVRCILEEPDGVLWVGTSYGLNRIVAGKVEEVHSMTDAKEPLEVVVSLHRDPAGGLWIGTMARGLFLLEDGRLHRFSTADGLPDNAISSILQDAEDRLWLATGNGLAVVSRPELVAHQLRPELPLNLRVYRRADGLRSPEMTGTLQPTAARSPDGRMWFCTADGLASIAPAPTAGRRSLPLVSLERIAVEGHQPIGSLSGWCAGRVRQEVKPTAEFGAAPAPAGRLRAVFAADGLEELEIPPQPERLDFQFISPSFVAPNAVAYRYRLSGFDKAWVDAGPRAAAYYTRVPPGRYRFEVEARNETGVWSQPGAAIGIWVRSSWWQEPGIRGLGAVLFLGSGVLFYQARTRRLRRQREEAAEFSRQLIRSQEQERARIAGELHDGLGQELQLIRNRAEIVRRGSNLDEESARQLASISETAARAIHGVRALSRGLRPPELDQLGLTEALRWLGRNCVESASSRLEFSIAEVDDAFSSDLQVDFYRVAQEALNNAIRHSGASEITFEVQWVGGAIQLSVFDNGRGFDPEMAELAPRAGAGLRNLRARAALLQGHFELQSEPNVGTRLTLTVPVADNRRPSP